MYTFLKMNVLNGSNTKQELKKHASNWLFISCFVTSHSFTIGEVFCFWIFQCPYSYKYSVNKLQKDLKNEIWSLQSFPNRYKNQTVELSSLLIFPGMFMSLSVCSRQLGSKYSSSKYVDCWLLNHKFIIISV